MIATFLAILLSAPLTDGDQPDQTGRVIELIADYQFNHDKVFKEGFAFFGKGVEVRESGNSTYVTDRMYLCVHEGPRRRLDASGTATANNTGRYIERWLQFLEYDDKKLFRPSMRSEKTEDASTDAWIKDEEKKQSRYFLAVPQPLRYLLKTYACFTMWSDPHAVCGTEYLLSNRVEMLEGKYTKERDIEASFNLLGGNIPSTMTIKFSKNEKYFPVEVLHKVKLNGKWFSYSFAEVTWEHRSGYSVPAKVIYTTLGEVKGSSRSQIDVGFDWKVGEQVANSIDPQIDDWRQPFKELFDADWQEANRFVPFAK